MPASDLLLRLLGGLVVTVTLVDVVATVLFPASGMGPLRRRLDGGVWWLVRGLARRLPPRRRVDALVVAGPIQILVTILAWFVLLVLGFALVYLPSLGTTLIAAEGTTDTGFGTAAYYSGYTLTTLGVGDVIARSEGLRILTVAESGTGFAVMTMVITYFLSVFSALPDRNAFASALHQLGGSSGDAAELVARQAGGGAVPWQLWLTSAAGELRRIEQTHRFYPVLRYFHFRDPTLALPHVLATCLDVVTVTRGVLDPRRHGDVVAAPGVEELEQAAHALLGVLDDNGRHAPPLPGDEDWSGRFEEAAGILSHHGYAVREDHTAYAAARSWWAPRLAALAARGGHEESGL